MALADTVLLLMAMLAMGVLIRGLFRHFPIPHSVMLVLAGMLVGALGGNWPVLQSFHLSPELVFFVFLPVLIFESGLSLNARQLANDVVPVLVLAIPALLVSTSIVGLAVWLLLPLDLVTALLFGALISATDPVAVVALFRELGTPLRLTTLVEGESLFNDATAIVLFTILLGLTTQSGFGPGDIGAAAVDFLRVFVGGALLGVGLGVVVSRIVIRLHLEVSSVVAASLVLAYTAFVVAEHGLHLSGVMAAVAAALIFAILAMPRLAEPTGHALHRTWEFLAEITNTVLFLLIGMTVDLGALFAISGVVLVVAVVVLLARAVGVYGLVGPTMRWFGLPAVSNGERHIMWWGGLKGGLAIAIVLSIPPELPGRELLLNLTLGVVLFSLMVNAPTIRPLLARLGLDQLTEDESAELDRLAPRLQAQANGVLDRLRDSQLLSMDGHQRAAQAVASGLNLGSGGLHSGALQRNQRLDILRAQGRELEGLYNAGVVPQYSYLDLKNDLRHEVDRIVDPDRGERPERAARADPFARFEAALVGLFREVDVASGLLSRYQNARIAQHIQKDFAQVLMLEEAIAYVVQASREEDGFDQTILPECEARLQDLHVRIADYQRDFERFYRAFETRFARRAALITVLRHIHEEFDKGVIGTKVFALVDGGINAALDQVPARSEPLQDLQVIQALQMVPFFEHMPAALLAALAERASTVGFLAGDVVIAEGEHGDALYIILRGDVRVSRADGPDIAHLASGDFFGEMALLGEHVRRATVTADTACTLLRLTARDIGLISRRFPEIETHLSHLKNMREEQD